MKTVYQVGYSSDNNWVYLAESTLSVEEARNELHSILRAESCYQSEWLNNFRYVETKYIEEIN
jgi:hypothetical protein